MVRQGFLTSYFEQLTPSCRVADHSVPCEIVFLFKVYFCHEGPLGGGSDGESNPREILNRRSPTSVSASGASHVVL